MTIIEIVLVCFILLELSNVIALYFLPGTKKANSVGVFTAWEKSKQYPDIHNFIRYLVYWIAGCKLIFLSLLVMILLLADHNVQRITLVVLAITTALFFWRLFPLIRSLDRNGEIEPGNYSVTLGILIFVFTAAFLTAAVTTL